MLTRKDAARVYDRIGRWQDTQRFYEDPAFEALVRQGDFDRAVSVFEAGCGTGRNARKLLRNVLKPECRYLGIDISTTMVRLATRAVSPWAARANVLQADATRFFDGQRFDRVLSLFLVDLLSDGDILAFLDRTHDHLIPGGLLCIAGLAPGERGVARFISSVWSRVHARTPALLGGCRPLAIGERLGLARWRVLHQERLCAYGLCSEAVIATPIGGRLA